MPRIARAVAVGLPHHITQRENYQQCVFQDVIPGTQYLIIHNNLGVTILSKIANFKL